MADVMICRCGHKHDEHGPIKSHNATAGKCLADVIESDLALGWDETRRTGKCDCEYFVIADS